jgi:hypothetical protein
VAGKSTVSWSGAADAVRYEVFENDRIITSSTATSVVVDAPSDRGGRYFVRAVDAEGNRSATSAVVETVVTKDLVTSQSEWRWRYGRGTAAAPAPIDLVPGTATWKWRYAATAPDANWAGNGFDDASWSSGTGEFGYGDGDENTLIPAGSTPRPLSAQFRTQFTVTDKSVVDEVTLNLVRDDGAVVYLNGQEVARSNMPANGTIAWDTPASTGISTRSEETQVHKVSIDRSALVDGLNTLAVEVHQSDKWSGDLSFKGSLVGEPVVVPTAEWNEADFDDSAWTPGVGHFGFGDGDESVVIGAPGQTSAQFRTTFEIEDASAVEALVLNLVRDDGAVVYLNGKQVARSNMPDGTVGLTTPAATAIFGAAENAVVPLELDPADLVDGTNTLAISVHNDWSGGGDLSFEVRSLSETLS